MILADTSVWIDHLRTTDQKLARLLNAGSIVIHPFVIGEIALGQLPKRQSIMANLKTLPRCAVAAEYEVLEFIEHNRLFGVGIGHVDAHLFAALRLSPGTSLWTRDKRLADVAAKMSLPTM